MPFSVESWQEYKVFATCFILQNSGFQKRLHVTIATKLDFKEYFTILCD